MSMPDLSHVPTYMPGAGETKKKKGFFSFLRKDRKFKLNDRYETSSTTSHQMTAATARKSASPPRQRRLSDTRLEQAPAPANRPKSMFVSSQPSPRELTVAVSNENIHSQTLNPPARKKRRAPAPPAPQQTAPSLSEILSSSSSKQDINGNEDRDKSQNGSNRDVSHTTLPSEDKENLSSTSKLPAANSSRVDVLSRLHSRNSSDSSGYHELTLSGCDSPEAGNTLASKSKISIDCASIESLDNNNGADSGIHDSPVRVSPIEEVIEKTDNALDNESYPVQASTLPSAMRKKKKAPAPPPIEEPIDSVQDIPCQNSVQVEVSSDQTTSFSNVAPPPSPPPTDLTHQMTPSQVISPPVSFNDDHPSTQQESTPLHMSEDPDISDEDIDAAFDLDDILNNVTFEDQPRPLKLQVYPDEKEKRKDEMMMMETSSVLSEDIGEEEPTDKLDRPCAFIPPPPPSEPPPPESKAVHLDALHTSQGPTLVDKETEVNDDNTSLAPASLKNSPEPVSPDGYKNEMALFVERMSRLAVDAQPNGQPLVEPVSLNDSLSSGLSLSETNSDTGSVIQHLRTDSNDSKVGQDAGSWGKKDLNKLDGMKKSMDTSEPTNFRVSEEISLPAETLPPPVQFDDKKEKIEPKKEEEEDDDEEEEYTEVVEEIVIPIGPGGYDFSAAKTVSEVHTKEKIEKKKSEDKDIKNGVFRAEPVSIMKATMLESSRKEEGEVNSKPAEKEEFVLTLDDLSSVTFVPPRPKFATRTPEPKEDEPQPFVSSAVFLRDTTPDYKHGKTEPIRSRFSRLSFTSEQETDSVLEEKSISLLNRMPQSISRESGDQIESKSNDFPTSSTQISQNSSRSSVELNSNHNMYNKNHHHHAEDHEVSSIPSFPNSPKEDFRTRVERPDSKASVSSISSIPSLPTSPREEFHSSVERPDSKASITSLDLKEQQQQQYDMLQTQFHQWRQQLANNQAILSQATGSDLQSEQIQALTNQMAVQQTMMSQIQATMQALQQEQTGTSHTNGHRASSIDLHPVNGEQAAAAAEPPAPPPPPPVLAAAETKSSESSVKSGPYRVKVKQRPRFERELDPREQLMIAIRSFQGREGLKSVSKKDTKWVHSNN